MPFGVALVLWAATVLWLPAAAHAQANACDQLKATLAARIEATGVRGYSLEVVPAATPAPAGAKAIGNCEGGARKVLYRRFGGASASVDAGVAASSAAPAPPAVAAPEPAPKRPPASRPSASASVASAVIPPPVPAPAAAASPEPARTSPARAAEVAPPLPAVVASVPAVPAELAEPPAETVKLPQRVFEFVAANRFWLLALLLVPLAVLGWAWRAHHLAYDKNGLPRGPRL